MSTTFQPDLSRLTVGTFLVDADGERAEVMGLDPGATHPIATLRTEHGRIVRVSTDMMRIADDGSCQLAFSLALLADEPADPRDAGAESPRNTGNEDRIVVPVVEEQLQVHRRVVDTGGVRVTKTVSEREEVVNVPLEHEEIEVVHVPSGRVLEPGEQALARHEGDTLVVPVLEEVLVVEKRWRLKEEVRITRHRRETEVAHRVVLRSEAVTAERFDEKAAGLPVTGK